MKGMGKEYERNRQANKDMKAMKERKESGYR
jgi:hypothetical protein